MALPTVIDVGGDENVTLPDNPTDTWNETDYQIQPPVKQRSTKPRQNQTFVDPAANEIVPTKNNTWAGIVTSVGPITNIPRQYIVLRQDLKRVTATSFGVEGLYSEYRVGDQVQITNGQVPNTWIIIGGPRKRPTPLIVASSQGTSAAGSTSAQIVPFNTAIVETANDESLFLLNNNTVKIGVQNGEEIIVEIVVQVTVECVDAGGSGLKRGITTEDINKGASGNVSEYTDGTNTTNGQTRSVRNDYGKVLSGKIVTYAQLGDNYYMVAGDVCA